MLFDNHTGLVLEGGGLRGVFTCGVLDCFMDHGIRFPFTVGVSAGACNGLSYMSNQRGRARISNIDLMEKYKYVGFKYMLTQGCIMDFKLLFEDFPERIIPYDYDAYFSNPERFVMVTTNCLTGKAEYLEEKSSSERVMDIVRASSSLPFVSKITYVDGIPMLDGGIVDSIPIQYALEQGYENLVVILTRNKGYRKKASKMRIAKAFYRKYPNLQKALAQRNAAYNQTMDLIEKLEAEGQITVIRPLNPVQVGRMEKDTVKLAALYDEGYKIAQRLVAGSDDIIIRKAKKEEASQIAELFMLAWPVEDILEANGITYQQLHEAMTEIARSEQTTYSYENTYIAETDGKIVGAMCAYDGADYQRLKQPIVDLLGKDSMFAHLKETEAGEFYLDSVGVLEEYRGRGIASRLFAAQIERARTLGHKVAGLIVDEDKPQAEALYARLGFRHLDKKDFFGHQMKHMVINL